MSKRKNVTWNYLGILAAYDLNVRAWCYPWSVTGLMYTVTGKIY